ncbi:hypothetical protein [Janthinobacterium sp. LB3P118]|uniref:hypothetical protein n=1 Tax=Janthinobacterium sp. LB3P118 TaxID=3424195 RepID=UPI003F28A644
MKTRKIFKKKLFLTLLPLSLFACQEHTSINGSEPKTEAYYLGHPDEAKVVTAKCKDFEVNAFSALTPSKQKIWLETTDGINCENAREANATSNWNAYQKSLRDAAAKYGLPEPEMTK